MQGIYLITNTITGARYVGQSIDIERRWTEHRTPNASFKNKSKRFIDDIKQYGISNFKFEVLEECERGKLLERERYWIGELKPEYNTINCGIPADTRKKISKTLKAYWRSMPKDQQDKIIRENLKGPSVGHAVRPETREKLRAAQTGKNLFRVRVIETGVVYSGMRECAQALGCSYYSIINGLKGKTKTTKGYHLERVETIRDECSEVGRG